MIYFAWFIIVWALAAVSFFEFDDFNTPFLVTLLGSIGYIFYYYFGW